MRLPHILSLFAILIIICSQANATLSTTALLSGSDATNINSDCATTDSDIGTSSASLSCSDTGISMNSTASADYGSLGASVSGNAVSQQMRVAPQATSRVIDPFIINGVTGSGYVVINFELTGTLNLDNNGTPVADINSDANVLVRDVTNNINFNSILQTNAAEPPPVTRIINQTITLLNPFNNSGEGNIGYGLDARLRCNRVSNPCSASSDFINTLVVTSATIVDENMEPMQGATLSAESGFNYINGGEPTSVQVPNPMFLYFILAGMFAMIGFRTIKRRGKSHF